MNTPSIKDPLVSIIMPVRNEAFYIEMSLGALLRQDYPPNKMEIVIADGMSTDSTRAKISKIKETTDIAITVIDNPKQIAPSGLNCAVAVARGDIIIRVDGHCEVEPDYVRNCVDLLVKGRAEVVGGPIETIGETLLAKAIAIAMSSKFGVGGSAFRTVDDRELYTDTVAFPGYTKAILNIAGPFNEELIRNQDDEYNYRIRKMGGRVLLSPTIRSRYFSRSSFKSLWRQYFQYGYWKVRVLQMHPRQMSVRQFIPFLFVSSLIIFTALSLFSAYGRWALLGISLLYICANITAMVISLGQENLRVGGFVSLSYAVIHVSYGLGFLFGLTRFSNRWIEKTVEPHRSSDGTNLSDLASRSDHLL